MTAPPDAAALLAAAHAELARMPGVLAGLVAGLDDAGWRARPAPSEWAPVEIVCHLRDEETEDFGARVRVIAKRGKRFTPIDPERWAVERRYLEDDGPGGAGCVPGASRRQPGVSRHAQAREAFGRRAARAHRPAVGARSARRVGDPRPPAHRTARGDARAHVGGALGAAPVRLRGTDSLRAAERGYLTFVIGWSGCGVERRRPWQSTNGLPDEHFVT